MVSHYHSNINNNNSNSNQWIQASLPDSFDSFKRFLKTILFSRYYSVTSALEVIFNEMRYINLRFTLLYFTLLFSNQAFTQVAGVIYWRRVLKYYAVIEVFFSAFIIRRIPQRVLNHGRRE